MSIFGLPLILFTPVGEEPVTFTRSWSRGIFGSVTGTSTISPKFESTDENTVMTIDADDNVFSANFGTTISNITMEAFGGTLSDGAKWKLSYGPNQDSLVDAIEVWVSDLNFRAQILSVPRSFFLPIGNFIQLTRISGTAGNEGVKFSGSCGMIQTVNTIEEISGDMEGNLPT